jgi:Na+/proline symporter
MCYNYGISGPFWFAAGCAFQIALMAVLGVLAKLRVPYAHTSLEIIQMRYRPWGHIVFALLNLINNVFGCASMILTSSQVIVGITGMNVAAATVLLPFGGRLFCLFS